MYAGISGLGLMLLLEEQSGHTTSKLSEAARVHASSLDVLHVCRLLLFLLEVQDV